jgi:hypothetical protein
MPISTKMAKSGLKKVHKKRRSNVTGKLNRAARSVGRQEAKELTPGAVTELFDHRSNRLQKKKRAAIIGNRRRT